MEFTTKDLSLLLNTSTATVNSAFRVLQIYPKMQVIKNCRKAVWTEEQKEILFNFQEIKKAFPKKNIYELLKMEEEIEAAGFKKIIIEEAESNPLVTDRRFNTTSFFPTYSEITPICFME